MSIPGQIWTSIVGLGFVMLFAGPADAGYILYSETITANGSLGGTSFSNKLVTINGVGDTSNIVSGTGRLFTNLLSSVTVTVDTVGSATFTDAIQATIRQNSVTGIGALSDLTINSIILGIQDPAFATYALGGPIGPLSDSTIAVSGLAFATTVGSFILNSAPGNTTFTASTAAVPEPSSLVLGSVALLAGLVHGIRRIKSNKTDRSEIGRRSV